MYINTKYVFAILLIFLFMKYSNINENFYGWIPTPTRYFKHIGSDLRGNPIFLGHDNHGAPVFYDKNVKNIGYGNKGYLGSFILGLFPFMYNYLN